MREIWFSLVVVLLLGGALPAAAQGTPGADAAKQLAVQPGDRVLGKADAPITIIEYASLTCPHCAHFEVDVLPKLKTKWIDTGKAKLVRAISHSTSRRCGPRWWRAAPRRSASTRWSTRSLRSRSNGRRR